MGWYTFYLSCTDFSFLMAIFFAMNVVPYRTELVMRPFQDRSCRCCRSHGHMVGLMETYHIFGRLNEYKILYAMKQTTLLTWKETNLATGT